MLKRTDLHSRVMVEDYPPSSSAPTDSARTDCMEGQWPTFQLQTEKKVSCSVLERTLNHFLYSPYF